MHPNDGRVVSNFIVQALNNRDLTIYGDGQQTRSFCYVDDLIRCMTEFMDTPDGVTGPINCGNPSEVTILELAKTIIAMTGGRPRLCIAHCRRTIRGNAARTSPWRTSCSAGGQLWSWPTVS